MITLPDDAPAGPVMAHTDALRTRSLIGEARGRDAVIDAHLGVLRSLAGGRPTWFPVFNYDFLRSGVYDIDADPAQVGVLNEAMRARASWRTSMPVFNFAGVDPAPRDTDLAGAEPLLPFGADSVFGQTVEDDGIVLWYGATVSTGTILHHAEHVAGGPQYRYDKDFHGRVDRDGTSHEVVLRYHVRPRDQHLDYDWPRLILDGEKEGVIRTLADTSVRWAPARGLISFWVSQLEDDPLYLLDPETRAWVEPQLHDLGRRFVQSDFETGA